MQFHRVLLRDLSKEMVVTFASFYYSHNPHYYTKRMVATGDISEQLFDAILQSGKGRWVQRWSDSLLQTLLKRLYSNHDSYLCQLLGGERQ